MVTSKNTNLINDSWYIYNIYIMGLILDISNWLLWLTINHHENQPSFTIMKINHHQESWLINGYSGWLMMVDNAWKGLMIAENG